jgi:hypothetical protein
MSYTEYMIFRGVTIIVVCVLVGYITYRWSTRGIK